MNTDMKMRVNALPVLTYNFLHVNDSELAGENINIDMLKSPAPKTLPKGVSLRTDVSFDEAGDIFTEFKDRILCSNGVTGSPNGDTSYLNASQALRTGMGAEVDRLMTESGVGTDVYTIEAGVKAEEPIILSYNMGDGQGSLSSQIIHAKKDSEITVIMSYESDKEASGFHGVSTRLLIEENAKVTLVKAQLLGNGYLHFDDIGAACLDGGKLELIDLELGGSRVWNGCYTGLSEKGTEFNSNLGYLCRENHNLDMNYVADHRGKKTSAAMQFRGVLMDEATKTFRGTIDFKSGSSGSVGDEQEDVLLLSPDVINRTMPVILCQEEDVEGRHGATIGELGEDLLFYMQTRGIDEDEAKRIMIKARLESVSRMIPEPGLMQRVQYYIQNIV